MCFNNIILVEEVPAVIQSFKQTTLLIKDMIFLAVICYYSTVCVKLIIFKTLVQLSLVSDLLR